MASLYSQSQDIMERFDFEQVRRVMEFLDWHWAACNGVPSIKDLKATARTLLDCAIAGYEKSANKDRSYWVATGGFKATVSPCTDSVQVSLLFYVTDCKGSE